jgi:hypothetical protein
VAGGAGHAGETFIQDHAKAPGVEGTGWRAHTAEPHKWSIVDQCFLNMPDSVSVKVAVPPLNRPKTHTKPKMRVGAPGNL